MSPTVTAYTNGMLYHIRVTTSSASLVTINLDSVGAKKLILTNGVQAGTDHLLPADYLISYNSALDGGAGAFTVVNELQHGLMNARGDYNAGANVYSQPLAGLALGVQLGMVILSGFQVPVL